jgi:LysM repeat protein
MSGEGLSPEQKQVIEDLQAKADTIAKLEADLAEANAKIASLESRVGSGGASTAGARKFTPPARTTPSSGAKVASATNRSSAPASGSNGFYYRVQQNDTLTGVAQKYNITVGRLASANNMPSNARLGLGQQIWIP